MKKIILNSLIAITVMQYQTCYIAHSEGSIENPIELDFNSMPYEYASVSETTGSSYYVIHGLTPLKMYNLNVSDVDGEPLELDVYDDDSSFSDPLYEGYWYASASRMNECDFVSSGESIYFKVSRTANIFHINIKELNDFNEDYFVFLNKKNLPFRGVVGHNKITYDIPDLDVTLRSHISIINLTGDADLSIKPQNNSYYVSAVNNNQTGLNSEVINVNSENVNLNDKYVYISVTAQNDTNLVSFTLNAQIPPVSEGTIANPEVLNLENFPYSGQTGIWPQNFTSYYTVGGLNIGQTYEFIISAMTSRNNFIVSGTDSSYGSVACASAPALSMVQSCLWTATDLMVYFRVIPSDIAGSYFIIDIK